MTHSTAERRSLVGKAPSKLSLKQRCQLLSVARSGMYYQSKGESAYNLELMRLIDIEYTKHPFKGILTMTSYLKFDCHKQVGHKRVERLYKKMGLRAIAPGPHTSKPGKEHKVYPYLLRDLKVTRRNQVWATDITYIAVEKGYMYLCAVIDLYSRYIVSWSLSNTMEAEWCRDTLREAVEKYGAPEIFNTDQGSQFTSEVFTSYVLDCGIRLSMDGKGRATDNIFIERFWRNVKHEDVYLKAYADGLSLYKGLKQYMKFYNSERRHSCIGDKRPEDVYMVA